MISWAEAETEGENRKRFPRKVADPLECFVRLWTHRHRFYWLNEVSNPKGPAESGLASGLGFTLASCAASRRRGWIRKPNARVSLRRNGSSQTAPLNRRAEKVKKE